MNGNKKGFDFNEESLGGGQKGPEVEHHQGAPEFSQNTDFNFGQGTGAPGADILATLSGLGPVTASSNAVSGNTDEVLKVFEEVRARAVSSPNALKTALTKIEDARVYIPSIALSYALNGKLFYVIFLLEALGRPLSNKIVQGPNGRNIEIDRNTIQYWDDFMQGVVETTLASQEAFKTLYPVNVAAVVIPRNVDLTNADKLAAFYDHGIAALTANARVSAGHPSSPLSADLLTDRSLSLVAKFDITPGHTYISTTGQPIVADFNAILYARVAGKAPDTQSIHGGHEDVALTSITGYFDFMRRDQAQPVNNMYQAAFGGMRPVPGYDPVLVITQNTCLKISTTSNDTVLSQLLALPILLPLVDPSQNKWATVFEPFQGDGRNKPSIGVLGLEHNPFPGQQFTPSILDVVPGGDLSTTMDKFTAMQIIQNFCSPAMIFALDVLQGGPLEWIQSLLAKALPGSDAEARIIAELDAFSKGIFSQLWHKKQQPILAAASTDLHAGYYVDGEGKPRDDRSIDYLAGLESTKGNQSIFDPFAAGFLPGTDNAVSMDQKRKILQQFAPNITFTGMYTRIFINPAFISTIDEMLAACKLNILVEGLADMAAGGFRQTFNSEYLSPVQSHGTFTTYARQQPTMAGGYRPWSGTSGLAADAYRR